MLQSTITDAALVDQTEATARFVNLYRELFAPLSGNVRFRVGDAQVAEDLAAEVFERALARLATVREPERVRAWLFVIARNVITERFAVGHTVTDGTPVVAHLLSLTPFRRIVKDYFMICDSYYQAIRTATPDKIEAIDMGRRAIHNDGSRILMERLKDKVRIDIDTARRLFTLLCVLHWKG